MKPECYDQIAKKDGFATVNDDQLAFVPCLLKFPGTAVYACNLCFNPSSRSVVSRSALILITSMIFGTKKVAFVFLSFGFSHLGVGCFTQYLHFSLSVHYH